MKSFETNVLIPTNTGTFVFADDAMTDSDKASLLYSLGFGSYSDAMTYIEDKKEYDRYVRNTYTTVPENEKENIRRFLDEFEGKDGDNAGTVDNELLYVYGMCEYLRSHYAYSLTADNTSDKSNTMLGNFLFGTRQGHCALYASAMTLALREKGIPARYITGFTTGKLELNGSTGMYEKPYTKTHFMRGLKYTRRISAGCRSIRQATAETASQAIISILPGRTHL